MLITEAICDRCGLHSPTTTGKHPPYWSTSQDVQDGKPVVHHFCSKPCRVEFDGTAITRHPCGFGDLDANILYWLARGYSNKEIARKCSRAESTIKNRLNVIIFPRLGAQDRLQAVLLAYAAGVLNIQRCAIELSNTPAVIQARQASAWPQWR